MEENFSIQRLQALLLRFWVEKKGSLIFPVVIIIVVFSLINFTTINMDKHLDGLGNAIFFVLGKWAFLGILVYHLHLVFAKGSGSVKTRLLHLLPASAAEKFTCLMFTGFVLPFVFYYFVFQLLNVVFVFTLSAKSLTFLQFLFSDIGMIGHQAGFAIISLMLKFISLLFYYLMFHLLVCGLIIFKDYAVLKVLGIFYMAYSILGFVVFQVFNAKFLLNFIATAKRYATDSPEYYSELSWSMFVLFFAMLSALFYVNYMQFKRKEIKV